MRKSQAGACRSIEGLARVLDHGNAILKPAIPFVPKRCLEMRDMLKASDLGEAVLGIERGVPRQMAEGCQRDELKAEVLRSRTRVKEEPCSDAPATKARPQIHLANVQAGRKPFADDKAYRSGRSALCYP